MITIHNLVNRSDLLPNPGPLLFKEMAAEEDNGGLTGSDNLLRIARSWLIPRNGERLFNFLLPRPLESSGVPTASLITFVQGRLSNAQRYRYEEAGVRHFRTGSEREFEIKSKSATKI